MSTINQAILEENVYIYPSANALDGGQLNTEENISSISDKFFHKNFVLKEYNGQNEPQLAVTKDGTNVLISKGSCFIEGRRITLNVATTLDTTTLKDELNHTIFDNIGVEYYILLQIKKDNSGCVIGDIDGYCGGVSFVLATTILDMSVVLGTVKATSASAIEVTDNSDKYCILDLSQIVGSDSISELIEQIINEILSGWDILTLTKSENAGSPSVRLVYGDNNVSTITNTGSGAKIDYTDGSSVTISSTGIIYAGASAGTASPLNIITKILELQSLVESGGVHVAEVNGTTTSVDGTTISNGTKIRVNNEDKDVLARANHAHLGYVVASSRPATVTSSSTQVINSNLSVTGTITGNKVYNAVWNDYADAVPKAEGVETEAGDIIAKDEYSDGYVLATSYNAKLVVGVHSDTYGHLLGGTEETLDDYIPIALAGNVKVKVVGKIKIGDFIVASFIPGVGVASSGYVPGTIVGKALQNKETDDVERILMQVMLI